MMTPNKLLAKLYITNGTSINLRFYENFQDIPEFSLLSNRNKTSENL